MNEAAATAARVALLAGMDADRMAKQAMKAAVASALVGSPADAADKDANKARQHWKEMGHVSEGHVSEGHVSELERAEQKLERSAPAERLAALRQRRACPRHCFAPLRSPRDVTDVTRPMSFQ
jgi:hypothetical protein